MTVFRKSNGVEVRHARLERIAHGTDARPMPVRPAFERAAEKYCKPLAAGPEKVGRKRRFRCTGMNAELIHPDHPHIGSRPLALSSDADAGDARSSMSASTACGAFGALGIAAQN